MPEPAEHSRPVAAALLLRRVLLELPALAAQVLAAAGPLATARHVHAQRRRLVELQADPRLPRPALAALRAWAPPGTGGLHGISAWTSDTRPTQAEPTCTSADNPHRPVRSTRPR